MVFQNYALYPHMSVEQNLSIGLRLRRTKKDERKRRVDEVARILGLEPLLQRKPAQLSGGQRQRVAMGRAMVREPQAFLMDEPLSNLDAKLRVQMRGEIARLRDRLHTTTIYVTHDQVEAMTLGDRVAVLKDGVVQQLDVPQTLYRSPANLFVAAFIGSPSMNLMEARVHGREVHLAEYKLPLPDSCDLRSYDGRPVVLGLRPSAFEDASLHPDEGAASITVPVDVVEELGSEVNVIFRVDAPPANTELVLAADEAEDEALNVPFVAAENQCICTARVDAHTKVEAGSTATLRVDMDGAHFFDPESGAVIGVGQPAAALAAEAPVLRSGTPNTIPRERAVRDPRG
jgi:multiple sugar transport system ATP-binding protein